MADTSHAVKRADSATRAIRSQMHINGGGLDGFMSHEGLDGEQVHPVFIQMGAKSMAEGVAGKPPWNCISFGTLFTKRMG